jgi:protein SCO1/2
MHGSVSRLVSMLRRGPVPVLVFAFLLAACSRTPERKFELRGNVVSVDKNARQVTLAHEKIPGYMDAMTMPFNVRDDWALSALEPGQRIEATLVVREDRSWIEDIRISGTGPVENSPVSLPLPEPGDTVPDFSLTNQDGQQIHLYQYRGRPLLLTFIYTRCPLPDYCPLMSGNFAAIHFKLQSLPPSNANPHLLTVSFDTGHDTPSVLKEYAARYMRPARFDTWEFATGTPEQIKDITGYFGLAFREESGQIVHSLVTALIGPEGKLVRLYHGNRWTPDEILLELGLDGDAK